MIDAIESDTYDESDDDYCEYYSEGVDFNKDSQIFPGCNDEHKDKDHHASPGVGKLTKINRRKAILIYYRGARVYHRQNYGV